MVNLALSLLFTLPLISNVRGCPGEDHDHTHTQHRRAFPQAALTPPTRALEWGDVNIIHTTDSHGWLLGHQKSSFPEPNYSGDLGDFASFVSHMKEIALSNKFLAQLPYDVMAIGNHELYVYANTLDMYKNFAPKLKGRYLSSNVNITVLDEQGNVISVPVGNRFAKFKTRKGKKVTALGVLFNFTGNDKNTTVQKVTDMVKEKWFLDAIEEEPDFFLLAGHMPVVKDDWPLVFNAVRAIHPQTPILIFGGHTHIRDCVQFDGRSMALESGRYMETVGWMSVKLDRNGSSENLQFSRRYLDPNRVTYEFHTMQRDLTFDTPHGKSISSGLKDLATSFDLDFVFGTAPRDFTISRDPFPSNGSLLTLFATEAVPVVLSINNTRANIPNIIIANSGAQRFDLYSGPFTRNDQFTASPFVDEFFFIPNVTAGIANQVLPALNNAGTNQRRALMGELERRESELYGRGYVDMVYMRWLEEMDKRGGVERRAAQNMTLGYVTQDSCPGIGDDVVHAPLPFFPSPDFIGSTPPNVSDDAPIDLVFVDFIEQQILQILNTVQTGKNYTSADVATYSPVLSNTVLGLYAQQAWN
ncbi:hypothetical protein NLI96_g5293 [Meripilus lineatus]|uniref:Calcineurin-like phosphoesterase domain-containing protein n=1 Tax=Meripilus lineatus TaxID=2056292 RepID=A0AAD5YJ46_9APHY|nr:hypothetical protein NLI96_g5293 [Physisporinus lineatus]